MKESTFAPRFEKLAKDAGDHGISARELSDTAGSSREQAYQWVRQMSTRGTLREVGVNGKRAKMFTWQEPAKALPRIERAGDHATTNGTSRVSAGNAGAQVREISAVEVGTTFTVTALKWQGGRMVAVLSGPGAEIEAELT